jgi:internalin A
MTWLKTLLLNGNEISSAEDLVSLSGLETLNLSDNLISSIAALSNIASLRSLDVSYNRLRSFPAFGHEKLEQLLISDNEMAGLIVITNFPSLKKLDLSNNGLTSVTGFSNLPLLEWLNISANMLSGMKDLYGLTMLTKLYLTDNGIEKIEGLESLKKLEYLDLFNNKIKRIENLQPNKQLKMLGLSGNEITVLENISHLKKLEQLYIGHNQIEDITELQNMKSLWRCVLTNNEITDLLPLKGFIENDIPIKYEYSFDENEPGFFIKENPIQYPPPEVIAQGKAAMLRHFSLLEKSLTEQLDAYQSAEVKLILVGNANVGKSYLAAFIKSKRKKLPPHNASTHGMVNEFVSYKQPGMPRPVKMRILDFGGQEYYHDTHHLFFTNDTIYLVLWEKESNRFGVKTEQRYSTQTQQYHDETNAVFPVGYWLDAVNYFISKQEAERVKNTGGTPSIDPAVILVETKRNRKGATLLDTGTLQPFRHLVHSQAAISLYTDTTGKLINTGTDALFDNLNDLVGSMYEKRWSGYYGLIVTFFDSSNAANTKLHQRANATSLMVTIQQCIVLFNSIIKNAGYKYKFDNDNALDLCRFLANRGYIMYFDENRICLHPDKLTEEIYKVLNKNYNTVGIIAEEELQGIDTAVISIMQEFRLIIPQPGSNGYIAPQLLPENNSSQLSMFLDAFKPPVIRFLLEGYIHKNIIQELFFAFREDLMKEETKNYIWKNGFVVNIENELYKINISSAESCRMIEVQYLTLFNKALLHKISANISTVLEGRNCTKEVSNDGRLFVPVPLIQQNLQLSQFVYNNQLLRVADYKNFLDDSSLQQAMKKLFISYSSKNTAFMQRFATHLEPLRRNGAIDFWHDRMIEPGTKWDDSIKKELELSDIIVFLLSPDFIANNYIFEVEIPQAIKQQGIGTKLFLLELQACGWDKTVLSDYQLATNPTGDNKAVIQIADPLNDTQWKLAIGELEKLLKQPS